jgi:hypothetical protein
MDVKAIIIISIIIIVIVSIIVFRVRVNRRSIRKVAGVTKDLRNSNSRRQANDTGINVEIGKLKADNKEAGEKATALRRNNDTRREIDKEARDILEGATHR